jgi:hypothetical protein
MPYYIMVEVETEPEAKRLAWDLLGEDPNSEIFTAAKLRAVWRKPTLFCDSGDGHRGKKTAAGWTRGPKWGWWVCGACGKPTKGWAGMWKFDSVMGLNLLPDAVIGSRPQGAVHARGEWTEEDLGREPNQVLDGGVPSEHQEQRLG